MMKEGTISGKIAKDVFEEMYRTGELPKKIVRDKGWVQILDEGEIEKAVEKAMESNPKQWRITGRQGKALRLFRRRSDEADQRKANPKLVNDLLGKKLRG